MKLSDLPEEIQKMALSLSNKIVRDLEGQPVELLDILDKAVVAGMELEAKRHNSCAENLWQALQAFRNATVKGYVSTEIYALVDQCLIENKPNIIIP